MFVSECGELMCRAAPSDPSVACHAVSVSACNTGSAIESLHACMLTYAYTMLAISSEADSIGAKSSVRQDGVLHHQPCLPTLHISQPVRLYALQPPARVSRIALYSQLMYFPIPGQRRLR